MKNWMFWGLALVLGLCSPAAVAQDGTASVEAAAQTSPKEKLDFARNAITEMSDSLKSVEKFLEQATRDGDEELIQCVRIKQASVKALLDVSERANESMQEALASGNDGRAEHEFRKIAVSLSKIRQFTAEAEACIGQDGVTEGTTEVDVDVKGITDGDETTSGDDIDGVVGIDPPDGSIFE